MNYYKTQLSLCKVAQIKQDGYVEVAEPNRYTTNIVCVLDSVWHELAIIVDSEKVLNYTKKAECEKKTYLKKV
jgi:hypothetical protein